MQLEVGKLYDYCGLWGWWQKEVKGIVHGQNIVLILEAVRSPGFAVPHLDINYLSAGTCEIHRCRVAVKDLAEHFEAVT